MRGPLVRGDRSETCPRGSGYGRTSAGGLLRTTKSPATKGVGERPLVVRERIKAGSLLEQLDRLGVFLLREPDSTSDE